MTISVRRSAARSCPSSGPVHGGEDYPDEVEPFSPCSWSLLSSLVDALRLPPGATLVDLGCGRGGPGLWLARAMNARLLGIDWSAAAVEYTAERAPHWLSEGRYEMRTGTFTETGLPDDAADAVVSVDALALAQDPAAALAEVRRITAPGGRVAFTAGEETRRRTGEPRLGDRAERRGPRPRIGGGAHRDDQRAAPALRSDGDARRRAPFGPRRHRDRPPAVRGRGCRSRARQPHLDSLCGPTIDLTGPARHSAVAPASAVRHQRPRRYRVPCMTEASQRATAARGRSTRCAPCAPRAAGRRTGGEQRARPAPRRRPRPRRRQASCRRSHPARSRSRCHRPRS